MWYTLSFPLTEIRHALGIYNSLGLTRITEREQFLGSAQSSIWLGGSCSWRTDRARDVTSRRLLSVIIVVLDFDNVIGFGRVVPGEDRFMYGLASRGAAVVAGHSSDRPWRLAKRGRGVCKSPG